MRRWPSGCGQKDDLLTGREPAPPECGQKYKRSKATMWRQVFLRLASCAALTTAAAACADLATAIELATAHRSVLIEGVPHVKQKPDFCGEACAEMYLTKLGKGMDQDYVFDQAGVDPRLGRGCVTRELATALGRIGFRTGNVWYGVAASNARPQLDAQFAALHKDLAAGVP